MGNPQSNINELAIKLKEDIKHDLNLDKQDLESSWLIPYFNLIDVTIIETYLLSLHSEDSILSIRIYNTMEGSREEYDYRKIVITSQRGDKLNIQFLPDFSLEDYNLRINYNIERELGTSIANMTEEEYFDTIKNYN